MTQEDIDSMYLNFEDFGGPDVPVTVENRSEYVAKRAKWILRDSRLVRFRAVCVIVQEKPSRFRFPHCLQRHLNAIKKGFEAIEIKSHLV
jgi:hypothetical protein